MSDYDNFIGRVKELSLIGSLSGIMGWDQETMMPPKGGKLRSEMMAFLSSQAHSRITDPEMGNLLTSLESQDLTEEQAANIVRNTMPNYDRVPKGVKALRQLPIGSFFSFPAEIIRTSANIARQSAKEMQSTNPLIRDRGLKRMAGFTVTTMGLGTIADMSAKLAGFNEEEQNAIAVLSETPWSNTAPRNIVKIDGKIYDISYSCQLLNNSRKYKYENINT